MAEFIEDVICRGNLSVVGQSNLGGATAFPDGSITSVKVAASADIAASKLQHRHAISHSQKDATDVVSETVMKYVAKAAGTVQKILVRPRAKPTGGDKQYTVDWLKAVNGSNTWTSFLTAVITVAAADTDDTAKNGTLIGSPVYAAGDTIRCVVTASGSTGSQGQGFVSQLHTDESGV